MSLRNLIAVGGRSAASSAVDAATRQDFESFHDLAWRAVQTRAEERSRADVSARAGAEPERAAGRRARDAASGLRAMGVPVDAATNEDFRRVRALPGWTETEGC